MIIITYAHKLIHARKNKGTHAKICVCTQKYGHAKNKGAQKLEVQKFQSCKNFEGVKISDLWNNQEFS